MAVDGWAMWARDATALSVADFGPSCLVAAAVAALAAAARSRLLGLLVLGSFAGDALINSAATVAEHAISTVLAFGVIAARGRAPGAWLRRARRAAPQERTGKLQAHLRCWHGADADHQR